MSYEEENRNLAQMAAPGTRHYHEPVEPHGYHVSSIVLVLFGVVVLILVIVGAIVDTQQVANASTILIQIVAVLAVAGLPIVVIAAFAHRAYLDRIKRKHARVDLLAKEEQIRRENEEHQMRMHLAATRLLADERGNRPFIYDAYSGQVLEVASGNYHQQVPAHYAPHYEYNYSDTSTGAGAGAGAGESLAGMQSPTMDYIISQLPYNGLQVCLGVSLETGNPFTMDLLEGTHYRIMGGSGFGKSCEAAAILEQVTQTNDPEHLLIACLDLEHKTSRLFENLPHVAQLSIGRNKTVDCVATNANEVATHFGYLRQELDRRKVLSEYDLRRERFMLIYVEEFLSLRREVNPELLDQMMKDFSILALRGRKYGLYLLACAQVDYSSKDLRDAMNQFNVNMSFAVKPTAARAAGFSSNELLKANFEAKQRGQFVLETTGCSDILIAPQFDVKAKLLQLETRSASRGESFTPALLQHENGIRTLPERAANGVANGVTNGNERTPEAIRGEVTRLRSMGWGKQAIIERVWNVKKGGSPRYRESEIAYHQIIEQIEIEEGA